MSEWIWYKPYYQRVVNRHQTGDEIYPQLEGKSGNIIRQQLVDEKSQRVVGLMNGGKKSQQVADQLDGGKKSHQVGGQIGWFIKNDTSCAAISNESCGTGCYRTNSPRFILYSMRHHVYNFTKSNRRNEV